MFAVVALSDSCNPRNCNLPGFSIHRIFQARIQEWVAISFSSPHLTINYHNIQKKSKHMGLQAERSYFTFKVRRRGQEDIPLVQGKEQWLHFAGATVKRYPTPKVRESQVRR